MNRNLVFSSILVLAAATASLAQPPGRPGGMQQPPPPQPGVNGGQPGQPRDWVKILDSNQNSQLDNEELIEAIDRTFAEVDRNHDGKIDGVEARPPRMNGQPGQGPMPNGPRQQPGGMQGQPRPGGQGMQPGMGPGGPPPPDGDGKRLLPRFFFDGRMKDADGVTKEEFTIIVRGTFNEMDANHDGVLTKDEARPPKPPGEPNGPPPPPPNARFIAAELRFGDKLITGQPFSAESVFEDTRRLYDGSTATKQMKGAFYRDAAGRTRREQPLEMVGGFNVVGSDNKPQMMVFINDFPAKAQYFLDTNNKVARKNKLGPGTPPDPPAPKEAKTDSLGTKMIEGISCEGMRMTFEIPARVLGTEKPMQAVTETWMSTELGVMVMSRHVDPVGGEHVFRLVNIRKGDPSADLFAVPSGYRIDAGPDKRQQDIED